uniref:Uncharacterized protein n=1 Tax=Medicago truncatula TaxID=3880 RepID=I3T285_MEDTR|nr:unknown [Medicago truncatula]
MSIIIGLDSRRLQYGAQTVRTVRFTEKFFFSQNLIVLTLQHRNNYRRSLSNIRNRIFYNCSKVLQL